MIRRLIAAFCFLAAVSCNRSNSLPVLGEVPDFQLVDQNGQPFDGASLRGKVWVADFMYTTCPGPCPMMSHYMHEVETQSDVTLVSFSVDPEHDTPAVLAAYAKHFGAQPGRWFFLTGETARLNDLGLHAFHLNAVDGSFEHSTRFVLMDRLMRIRGYYETSDAGFLPRLLADIRRIERESS